MKKLLFLSLIILSSCMSGSAMSMQEFDSVPVGTTASNLEAKRGKPYAINKISNTEDEYEYIEKIQIQSQMVKERHYFFLIRNGLVVSKRIQDDKTPPLYFRNSYQLQTSDNRE